MYGGGKPSRFTVTDICDGMAQGHDGINYSLPSRDIIADLVEIHANATTFDGGVFLASCDKSAPALLMAIGRINIPAVFHRGHRRGDGCRAGSSHSGADRQIQRHV